GEVAEVVGERFFGLIDRRGGDGAELAYGNDRVGQFLSRIGEHGQRLRDRGKRLINGLIFRRDLSGQRVETFGGRDDVVGLSVQLGNEGVQLGQQATHVL